MVLDRIVSSFSPTADICMDMTMYILMTSNYILLGRKEAHRTHQINSNYYY